MDTLSWMGFSRDGSQFCQALNWFRDHQEASGLWKVTYACPEEYERESLKNRSMKGWGSLAICRIFHRFYG